MSDSCVLHREGTDVLWPTQCAGIFPSAGSLLPRQIKCGLPWALPRMSITAAEAVVRHLSPVSRILRLLIARELRCTLFAVAAAIVASGW